METTGQRFKKIRDSLSLSQEEFAKKIKLSKSAVSAVENNKSFVSSDVLRTLFMDFNINLNWLICGAETMNNSKNIENIRKDILNEVNRMLKERGL